MVKFVRHAAIIPVLNIRFITAVRSRETLTLEFASEFLDAH